MISCASNGVLPDIPVSEIKLTSQFNCNIIKSRINKQVLCVVTPFLNKFVCPCHLGH